MFVAIFHAEIGRRIFHFIEVSALAGGTSSRALRQKEGKAKNQTPQERKGAQSTQQHGNSIEQPQGSSVRRLLRRQHVPRRGVWGRN